MAEYAGRSHSLFSLMFTVCANFQLAILGNIRNTRRLDRIAYLSR